MKDKAVVSIQKCSSYDVPAVTDALRKLLEPLGGMKAFAAPGKKVFIKPNLLLAAVPDRASTTHPAVMEAIILLVQEAGAEAFFGDLPGGFHVGNSKIISEKCGMNKVAEKTGATLVRLEQHSFRDRPIPHGDKLDLIHTPKFLDDMDVIISVPKLKTHMQSVYTGAIKNVFGFITTRDRMNAHAYNKLPSFSSVLVDIFSVLKPDLNIMDAIVGMEGTGPSQGKPVKIGMMLASTDAVALDATAAAAVGFGPQEVLTTTIAAKRGLGVADLGKIRIEGASLSSVKKKISKPSRVVFTMLPFLNDVLQDATSVKPYIDEKKCKKCRQCVEVCPASAINTSADYKINDDVCILCFCCHEVCPHDAVKLKKGPLLKLYDLIQSKS